MHTTHPPTVRPPFTDRYGLGIRFLRQEYARSYDGLELPLPLPPAGAPYTELTTGGQEGLPVYTSRCGPQEDPPEALRTPGAECALCSEPFETGATVMSCYHCQGVAHVRCLADRMLRGAVGVDRSEVIPSEGSCPMPACARGLLWSRLVRSVQPYRPKVGATFEEISWGGGAGSGDSDRADGPLVWRVEDSSGDDGDDDDSSEGESERTALGDEGSSSDTSRDIVTQLADDDDDNDDSFWRLSGGSAHLARRTAAVGETSRGGGQSASYEETLGEDRGASGSKRRLATCGRQGKAACRSGEDDVVIAVTSEGDDDDGGGCGDCRGREDNSSPSPPKLPLAERLRLRRLHRAY